MGNMMNNKFIWEEKYRPTTVDECILTPDLHNTLKSLVNDENFPSVIFHGQSGVGKTTAALAIVKELGLDYIVINGSLNGNIDTLRNEILNFASTLSFNNKRKIVIIDEADGLNINSTQPALRNFIDEYKDNCGFIFTCNDFRRITKHLQSRCFIVDFKVQPNQKSKLAKRLFDRTLQILDLEEVKYEKEVVANVVKKHFPDFRRILNELQGYSRQNGSIDSGILTSDQIDIQSIVSVIKGKDFPRLRAFVVENFDDYSNVYDQLYNGLYTKCSTDSIPDLVLIIAKYQYQAAFVASQEINLSACLVELMTLGYK
jgi:DNA polymerase III delta prime subunit